MGLQHNAQLFFKKLISYDAVFHDWSTLTHDIFLVRDLNNHSLIYDSIDGLVLDLFHQGAYNCALYPFDLLFPHFESIQSHYLFETTNYPVLVFNLKQSNLALIKIEKEYSKEIQAIGDPREFWGASSTQDYSKFMLFSLIPLDSEQMKKIRSFNFISWESFYNETQNIVRSMSYQFYEMYEVAFTNNLYLYPYEENHNHPFLETSSSHNSLAFTMLEQIKNLRMSIHNFKNSRNEMSEYHNLDNEERNQFDHYEKAVQQQFIQLICHTANHYQTSYISMKTQNELEKEIILSKEKFGLQNLSVIENLSPPESKAISAWRALTILLIVLGLLFIILYGLFLLVQKYEFTKFLLIITTIASLLVIIGKK